MNRFSWTKTFKNKKAQKVSSRRKLRSLSLYALIVIAILLPTIYIVNRHAKKSEAAWYNDNWSYRTQLTFGNSGSADSNKKVKFDIDTAALITAGKLQSDCGDSRFTDVNGIELQYYIDTSGGACNTNSTDYYVLVTTIQAETNSLYHYYGNPSVANGTQSAQFSQSTFSPTSGPSTASEENSPAPVLYFKLNEQQGSIAYDSSTNQLNGTLGSGSSAPTWKNKDECISEGCLDFDGSNDYVSVADNNALDITNTGTVQAWVRADDTASAMSNFTGWTTLTAPNGSGGLRNFSNVDMVVVGSKLYYASYLFDSAAAHFQVTSSNLDGSSMAAWTALTLPTITSYRSSNGNTRVAVDSDGVKLYYSIYVVDNSTVKFFTGNSNLDGSSFSGWTSQSAPTAADVSQPSTIDMVIVDSTMYYVAYTHGNATAGTVSTARSNLDGTSFSGWTAQTSPSGVINNENTSSITIDSDGRNLYYAAYANNNGAEAFYTASSPLNGTITSWTTQTAPDGGQSLDDDVMDMVIVGNKMYLAIFIHAAATEFYRTASVNLDGTSMSAWTAQTNPDGTADRETAAASIATDGKKLYYLAFTTVTTTETLKYASADVTSHPVISKSGAYELIQTGGGFAFTWSGPTNSFGSINATDWNHVAITQDGTTMKYFVNGAVVRTQATTTDFTSNSSILYIGSDLTRYFDGKIDELKVYPYARSETEIKEDYISRGGSTGVEAQFGSSDLLSGLQEGLIGWWKMEETSGLTTADSSGAGNTGTLGVGSSAPTFANGRYGNGLTFDGSNDYVNAGSASILDNMATTTTDMSVSAWLYFNVAPDGTTETAIAKTAVGAEGWQITRHATSGVLSINTKFNSGTSTTFTSAAASVQTWFQVTGVWNKSSMLWDIYINGVKAAYGSQTASTDTSINDATANLDFGMNSATSNLFFEGKMDEVRIYNRMLSPGEVAGLYNWAPGPDVYYKFDEGTGTSSIIDSSGNDASGTPSGTVSNSNWTTGKYGNAYSLSGDDYITTNDTMSVQGLSQFTISTWLYPRTLDGTTRNIYLECIAGSCTTRVSLVISTDNALALSVRDDDGDASSTNCIDDSRALTVSAWNHIEVVYNADINSHVAYLNGVPFADTGSGGCNNPFGTGVNASNKPKIGSNFNGTTNFFDGIIDDFKMYHYARTPGQVIEDMNAGHPLGGSPIGSQVAYYKFDDMTGTTAYDKSINANDLTLSTASWTASGKVGGAWNGVGTNWVSRADDADLDFVATDDFTVSSWIKSDSATNPGSIEYIVNKASATAAGYAIYANTNGTLCFGIDDDTTWNPDIASCTTADFYDGSWHYVAGVRDHVSTDSNYIYIDGVLKDSDSDTTSATLANTQIFYIGDRDGTDNGTEFNGDVDEVKVYRAALTADQVKVDYNLGKAQVMGSTGTTSAGVADNSKTREYCVPGGSSTCNAPVGEWKFDEGTGSTLNDTSGNGNSLTIAGSPPWVQGKKGNALNFTDNNAMGATGSSTSTLQIIGDESVTLWVNASTIENDDFMVTVRGDDEAAANNESFYLSWDTTSGNDIKYQHENGAGVNNANTFDTNLSTNTWYFIGFSRDVTANTVKLYVNGVQTGATYTYTNDPTGATTSTMRVAYATTGSSTNRFQGKIDQIEIYNYARTPAQMAWDYNRGAPVAWYKFDECQGTTINDWAPNGNGGYNGNNGTLNIGASGSQTTVGTCSSSGAWANGASGKTNASFNDDGTDDYISVPDSGTNSPLDFGSGDTITVTAWVKPSSTLSNYYTLATKGLTTGVDQFNWWAGFAGPSVSGGNNSMYFDFSTGGGSGSQDIASTSDVITPGVWQHVAYVFTFGTNAAGGDSGHFYVNGNDVRVGSNNGGGAGTPDQDNNPIWIGADNWSGDSSVDELFPGQIDDLKIYRYGLTQKQIQSDMNNGSVSFK